MDESGNGEKKVFSFLDKQQQCKDAERDRFYARNPDVFDFSRLEKSEQALEIERENACDAKAVQALKLLGKDPRLSEEAVIQARKGVGESTEALRAKLESSTHETWLQDPVYYWAIADAYLCEVDAIAERILNKELRSHFPRLEISPKARSYIDTQPEFLVEKLRESARGSVTEVSEEGLIDVALAYRKRRAENDWEDIVEKARSAQDTS